MLIRTQSVRDFLKNLLAEGTAIYRKAVYEERSSVAMNGATNAKATSFEIYYQVSAIVDFDGEAQMLLVCGEYCGIDRLQEGDPKEGDKKFKELQTLLRAGNEDAFTIFPGSIGGE